MPFFYDPESRAGKQLLPGIRTRTFWGEKMLISLVDLEAGASIPPHSHPHEQLGTVLEGEVALTVAGETRVMRAGEVYVAPGGIQHSAQAGEFGVRLFEVFSPVREEYKY